MVSVFIFVITNEHIVVSWETRIALFDNYETILCILHGTFQSYFFQAATFIRASSCPLAISRYHK